MNEDLFHLLAVHDAGWLDVIDRYSCCPVAEESSIHPNIDEVGCRVHAWSSWGSDVDGWEGGDWFNGKIVNGQEFLVDSPHQAFNDSLSHVEGVVDTFNDVRQDKLLKEMVHNEWFHVKREASKGKVGVSLDLEVNSVLICWQRNFKLDCDVENAKVF